MSPLAPAAVPAFRRPSAPVVLAGGAAPIVLGTLVLAGWAFEIDAFVRVSPTFVPMHVPTALALVTIGIALLAFGTARRRLAATAGAAVGLAGGIGLVGNLIGIGDGSIDAGDPLLFPPFASACTLLAATALLVMSSLRARARRALALGFLGSLISGLAVVVLCGYVGRTGTSPGIGAFSGVAIHTAAAFAIVGFAVLAFTWQEAGASQVNRLPIAVGMGALTVTVGLWQALLVQEREQVQRITSVEAAAVEASVSHEVRERVLSLIRMAGRWEQRDGTPHEDWLADAGLYLRHHGSYDAIAWADDDGRLRWIVPEARTGAVLTDELLERPDVRFVLDCTRDSCESGLTAGVELGPRRQGVLAVVPVRAQGEPDGYLLGLLDVGHLIDGALASHGPRFSISVSVADEEIYSATSGVRPLPGEPVDFRTTELFGVDWRFEVWPRPALPAAMRSSLPEVVLVVGLPVALLLGVSIYLAQTAQARARETARANRALAAEVAERKDAERRLQELATSLEERVAARTRELEESHRELREAQLAMIRAAKLEEIDHLAASVAHEVKNPLGIVLLGLHYLKRHDAVEGDTARSLLDGMEDAVRRADRVVRGLMDFAAPRELTKEPCDLDEIVERALLLVKGDALEAHALVDTELAGDLPDIAVDEQKITQVLVNLLSNAFQAMGRGGVLTVRSRHDRERDAVVVEIADTGPGIDPEAEAHIFDPFFTTKPAGQGTGLGLSVTRKIMELHGAAITMRNRRSGGAKATLVFPFKGEEACPPFASSSSTTRSI